MRNTNRQSVAMKPSATNGGLLEGWQGWLQPYRCHLLQYSQQMKINPWSMEPVTLHVDPAAWIDPDEGPLLVLATHTSREVLLHHFRNLVVVQNGVYAKLLSPCEIISQHQFCLLHVKAPGWCTRNISCYEICLHPFQAASFFCRHIDFFPSMSTCLFVLLSILIIDLLNFVLLF